MGLSKLYQVWEENQRAQINTDLQSTDLKEADLNEIFNSIVAAGPYYYYVIDFYDMRISHVSDGIKDIHGIDAETVTFNDILSFIHPEDIDFVSRAEAEVLNMFNNVIGRDKLTKQKVNYCFRFKMRDNTYKLFSHQAIVLTIDEKGGFSKSFNIHTDISHLVSENNYKISLLGLFGEPSYVDIDVYNLNSNKIVKSYSKREIEIVRLISEGLTNIEISTFLNIAIDTVKNHRKNIFHKAGVKNVAQLIKRSVLDGII